MDHRITGYEIGNTYGRAFDPKSMTITVEVWEDDDEVVYTLPAKYEVCPTCEGSGKHVNPSIDSHGISAEEFREDPGFAEDYFRGMYDVPCYECGGRNVVPRIDEGACVSDEDKRALKAWREQLIADADYRRMCEYERRMGA